MMETISMNVIQSFSFKKSLVLANIHISPQRDKKGHLHSCHWMSERHWVAFDKEFEKILVNYFMKNILADGRHKFIIGRGIEVVVRISSTSSEALLECMKSTKIEASDSIVSFDCFIERGVSKSAKEDSSYPQQELELIAERISKKNTAKAAKGANIIPTPISRRTRSHDRITKVPADTTGVLVSTVASDAQRPGRPPKKPVENEKAKATKQKCAGDTSQEMGSNISDVDETKVKRGRKERNKAKERENHQRETSKTDNKRSARKTCKEDTTESTKKESSERNGLNLSKDEKLHGGEKATKEKAKRKTSHERDGKKYKKTRPLDDNSLKDENGNRLPLVVKEEKPAHKTAKRNQKEAEKIEALFGSFISDDEDEDENKYASTIEKRAIFSSSSTNHSLNSIICKLTQKHEKSATSKLKKMETLDLKHMLPSEVLASFDKYKHELDNIFQAKHGTVSIDHFLVIFLVNQKVQFAMLQKLNEIYETDTAKDHSHLLLNAMLPEWLLLLFMDRYGMSREQAVQQLYDQDKHNALYGGDLLDFERPGRLRK